MMAIFFINFKGRQLGEPPMSQDLLESGNIKEQRIIKQLLKMGTSTEVRSMASWNNFYTSVAEQVIPGGVLL